MTAAVAFDFVAYLSVGGYYYATTESYHNGQQYLGALSAIPAPSRALKGDYGITPSDSLTVSIADPAMQPAVAALIGQQATVEHVLTTHFADGSSSQTSTVCAYVVNNFGADSAVATLDLVDFQTALLDAVYPFRTWTADDWPGILQADAGNPVAWATGTALKIPAVLLSTNGGSGPWVYGVCEAGASVLGVYRNDVLISSAEYTAGTATAPSGYTVMTLSFAKEQVDFSGSPYAISVDCAGSSNNAVTELQRIVTAAGLTVDATSFAAAVTYATSIHAQSDCGYTQPRAYSSIVQDLLLISRASLVRNSSGAFRIIQDVPGSSVATYDENAGDLVTLTAVKGPGAPKTVTLQWGPNPASPASLQYTTSRDTGGYYGTKAYVNALLYDPTAADMCSDYLTKRLKYGGTAKVSIYGEAHDLGDIITISSLAYGVAAQTWRVAGIKFAPGGQELTLQQYDPAVYVYTAQAAPTGATQGYSPDYSKTPPAAPTSLAVVSTAAALTADGTAVAYAAVRCVPPAVNWSTIYFQAACDATGEISQGIGALSGSYYVCTLAGLRPNSAYHLTAWAVNAFNVQGVVASSVAFTAGAYGAAPGVPSAPMAAQGTGKVITVTAPAVSGAAVKLYQWQRSVNGGAWAAVNESSNSYTDSNVSYGSTYAYRVQAVDFSGNASGYSSSSNVVTLQVNVGNNDITTGGVQTPNIADSNVTTGKRSAVNSYSQYFASVPAGGNGTITVAHGLGTIPLVTVSSDSTFLAPWSGGSDMYNIYAKFVNVSSSSASGTITLYYW